MTHGKRKRIFYALLLAFFLIGSGGVFYAQGWRFDIGTFSLNKVGALYVRSYPSDTKVFLNNEEIRKRFSFFDRGMFIDNLFPKRYTLTITREGYRTLTREIDIVPSFVTELRYGVLLPLIASPFSQTPVSDFFLLQGVPVTQSPTGTLTIGTDPLEGLHIKDISRSRTKVLTQTTTRFLLEDINNATTTDLQALAKKSGVFSLSSSTTLSFIPGSEYEILIRSERTLMVWNLQRGTLERVALDTGIPLHSVTASAQAIAYTRYASGTVHRYALGSGTTTSLSPNLDHSVEQLLWNAPGDTLAILLSNGDLFLVSQREEISQKLASDVRQFSFSESGSMVAALEQSGLEIFDRENDIYWRFNIPDPGNVERVMWYGDERHLFVVYSDRTAFLDLDDKRLEDFGTIVPTGRVAYDPESNIFYFLDGETLKTIEFAKR